MLLDDFQPRPVEPHHKLDKNKRKSFEPISTGRSASLQSALDEIESIDESDEVIDKKLSTSEQDVPEKSEEKPAPAKKPTKKNWYSRLNPKNWSKKQLIIVLTVTVVVLAGAVAAYFVFIKKTAEPTTNTSTQTEQPAQVIPIVSPLTGEVVTAEQAKLPVTGVMIENSPDARPQSGLDSAGVVFEAVAEGGITRFLALFQESQPDYIGPVRSVRPYYIDWAVGFDAAIAHVGGSPEALSKMSSVGAKDLDQFANGNAYTRINSRSSPHNVYTSLASLLSIETNKGYTTSNFTPWERKVAAPSSAPNATSINLEISSALYNSHYDYDQTTNKYKRSEGGAAHMQLDKNGQKSQIKADVVIAMAIGKSLESDGIHTIYTTISSGQALIFQDGTATAATWRKTGITSQIAFTDQSGNTIKLNPGKTWITAVDAIGRVTYN